MSKKPISKPKVKKPSKFEELFKEIGVSETYTKKEKHKFDTFKNNTYPVGGYNYMCDLLEMPITSKGYHYILSVVDLYNKNVDIEAQKTKTAKETIASLLKIFKRKYLKDTKLISMKTDNGGEFKESFDAYLKKQKIAHLYSLPDRHSQMSPVENLNKQLGRAFMTYLTDKTMKLGKPYNDWTDVTDIVRTHINKMKVHPKDLDPYTEPMVVPDIKAPHKYDVNDIVYRPIEKPADGVFGITFRQGDIRYSMIPCKVKKVLLYKNNWRYILNGFETVSYAESELLPSNEKEEKWEVKQIRDKRKVKGDIEYLVWWKRYKVDESTWESKEKLLEDGLKDMIDEFELNHRKKVKK